MGQCRLLAGDGAQTRAGFHQCTCPGASLGPCHFHNHASLEPQATPQRQPRRGTLGHSWVVSLSKCGISTHHHVTCWHQGLRVMDNQSPVPQGLREL